MSLMKMGTRKQLGSQASQHSSVDEDSDAEDFSDASSIGSLDDLMEDEEALEASLGLLGDELVPSEDGSPRLRTPEHRRQNVNGSSNDSGSKQLIKKRKSLEAKPQFLAKTLRTHESASKLLPAMHRERSNSQSSCSSSMSARIASLPVGTATEQGRRSSMEDYVSVKTNQALVAGLFDGHGGARVSRWLQANFCREVLDELFKSPESPRDLTSLMNNAMRRVDLELLTLMRQRQASAIAEASIQPQQRLGLRRCKSSQYSTMQFGGSHQADLFEDSGSTATVAVIVPSEIPQLVVAWVGDSRAVMSKAGRAVPLTRDHKPTAPTEKERITRSGGMLSSSGRLNHDLSVSRALGSFKHKQHDLTLDHFSAEQDVDWQLQEQNPLSSIPEVCVSELCPDDDFVLIASDGVWDCIQNDTAVRICLEELKTGAHPDQVAQTLLRHAYDAGSADNLSAILICFRDFQ